MTDEAVEVDENLYPSFWLNEDRTLLFFQCCVKSTMSQLPIDNGSKGWKIICVDPLTIAPSIAVKPCGCHGWIKQGVWETA